MPEGIVPAVWGAFDNGCSSIVMIYIILLKKDLVIATANGYISRRIKKKIGGTGGLNFYILPYTSIQLTVLSVITIHL